MLHIVVTGGCGFIGSHLVERLIQQECAVTVVDDMRNGNYIIEHPLVNYIFEDVCETFPSTKVSAIIHLANTPRVRLSMEQPADAIMNNVGPTVMVAEWAKHYKCPLFFAQSSSTMFSDRLANPYTFGKVIAEETLQLYEKHWGLDYSLLYFYNVYGPREADYGEHSTVIRAFKNKVLAKEPLRIYGSGKKSRDFSYVGDVVEGILKLLSSSRRKKRKDVHLGAGYPYTIMQIAEAFDHPFIHEFDRPGEAEKTLCKEPYYKRTVDTLDYIRDWKKRIHNAETDS